LTADLIPSCPYLPASYATICKTCESLKSEAPAVLQLFLGSLQEEIETTIQGGGKTMSKAKALVKKLWGDPDHKAAIKLLIEHAPTPRQVWATELLHRIKVETAGNGVKLKKLSFYPGPSDSPNEIKVVCQSLLEKTKPIAFWFVYLLLCREIDPDVGNTFDLKLMAWCENPAKARPVVQSMGLGVKFPPSTPLRNWSQWEWIWSGGSYTLRDLGDEDVEGLAKLVAEGIRETYSILEVEVAKLPSNAPTT
jgi:hypothetical protein